MTGECWCGSPAEYANPARDASSGPTIVCGEHVADGYAPLAEHDCREHLTFRGWLGAPGVGQSWECEACGERFWSPGGADAAVPFADLDPSAYILDADDVG
jgi:hypothetical protein